MFVLQNRALRLDILDPIADAARLGPRYCWGGYVWQVHHHAAGALLVGPEWPHAAPTAFNGQGLPESFRHRALDGRPFTWRGDSGVALGAGSLRAESSGDVALVAPCVWQVVHEATRVIFSTRHAAAGFNYELTRTLELRGAELQSSTRLVNASSDTRLTLEWFAHPFFPLVGGVVDAEVPAGSTIELNAGFALHGRRVTQHRRFLRQDDGHMERSLRLPTGQPFVATLAHPGVGSVTFATSFAPSACVIWGNDRTFSFEPYLALDLAPGDERAWHLTYRFGAAS